MWFARTRAVFKGELRVQPPRNYNKKIFSLYKITCSIICGLRCLARSLWNARKSHLASTKCNKPLGRPGLRPGPLWGSLQRSPRPFSWWGGGWLPLPKNLTPALAFQASGFGPLGLASSPRIFKPHPKQNPTYGPGSHKDAYPTYGYDALGQQFRWSIPARCHQGP